MAGSVPQIEAPTEQSDALPITQIVAPNANVFGAQVGQGLDQAGAELFDVGLKQYHQAAEAMAQQKENDFTKGALQIRDKYKNLYQGDAVAGHNAATEALEALDKQLQNSLPSKYGTALYNNNKLRTLRNVQESIDGHFEQENKAFQYSQYKTGENTDAAMVAGLALDSAYPSKNIEDTIMARKERALEFAKAHGLDPDSAEAFSKNATYKLTDALFKTLFDPHSTQPHELIKSELDKYAKLGLVDAGRLKASQDGLAGTESDSWVAKTMANFVPVSSERLPNGKLAPDPKGHIATADIQAAIDGIAKDDPLREKKIDSLYKEVAIKNRAFVNAGAELEGVVRRKMQENGGLIPTRDQDWQDYNRLYPVDASKLADKVSDRQYQQGRHKAVTEAQANTDAFGQARYYMSQLTTEQAKQMSPAAIDKLVNDGYAGSGVQASPGTLAKAQEYAKKVQTEKQDPVEKQFNSIASQSLEAAYKGDTLKTRTNMGRAHALLSDLYEESKAKNKPLSAAELGDKLVQAFSKPGFLQKPSGESYQPRPSDARMGKDGNWYVPRGAHGGWVPYGAGGN